MARHAPASATARAKLHDEPTHAHQRPAENLSSCSPPLLPPHGRLAMTAPWYRCLQPHPRSPLRPSAKCAAGDTSCTGTHTCTTRPPATVLFTGTSSFHRHQPFPPAQLARRARYLLHLSRRRRRRGLPRWGSSCAQLASPREGHSVVLDCRRRVAAWIVENGEPGSDEDGSGDQGVRCPQPPDGGR